MTRPDCSNHPEPLPECIERFEHLVGSSERIERRLDDIFGVLQDYVIRLNRLEWIISSLTWMVGLLASGGVLIGAITWFLKVYEKTR